MIENQLYWIKSQHWPTDSQNSSFLVNINILKSHSSFDQGLIIIHQEIAQKSKVAKLGFCGIFLRRSQLNFDQAQLSHASSYFYQPKLILKEIKFSITLIMYSQVQKVLHLGNMSPYIIGHFRSQQKTLFVKENYIKMSYSNRKMINIEIV